MLCPGAVFELTDAIYYTADRQQIYTQGSPTDDSRALLRITGESLATAIDGANFDHIVLRNLMIDGARPQLGVAQGALIEFGRGIEDIDVIGQTVEWVRAYEPRGWTVLYLGGICTSAVARNNEFGPSGDPVAGMGDGISLECPNSIVENNTIVDATDGGIVIFQSPGSLIAHNTIRAESRIMFYGISMEDYHPREGDFTGTRVVDNVIDAHGALIRRGVAMGPGIGCIDPPGEFRSHGAVVSGNTLMGSHMGYGFVMAGVQDWTVTDNVDVSRHLVPDQTQDCFGNAVDNPTGFMMNEPTSTGEFQVDFAPATLGFTTEWWPARGVVSESCVQELIGTEVLEDIRSGGAGQLWPALESVDHAGLLPNCITLYQQPDITDLPEMIQVGVMTCEPFCITVDLINLSDNAADIHQVEFLLEDFPVECRGLPEVIPAGEIARCTIDDYVTTGFQDLSWYGLSPSRGHWGIDYPAPTNG